MTLATTTISGGPNATTPLTGAERVIMDQGTQTVDASTRSIADLALTQAEKTALDNSATLAATAVQPAALTTALAGKVDSGDSRLTDAREWSAATVTLADVQAGVSTVRRAFTVERVWQAIGAWWAATAGATGQALVAAATPAAARTTLQLGTAAQAAIADFATAAQGALATTAVQPAALSSGLAGKADLVGGVVPSAQLPGFVDDVLEFATVAAFPATGESGKLYVSLATNRVYRWSGSLYVEIAGSPGSTDAVPEGSVNLYFTTARGEAAAASWWAASASKTKLDGIATGATAFNPASPGAIGGTTPAAGTFTRLLLPAQGSAPGTPSSGFTLYANSSNALSWVGANGWIRTFDGTANTGNRTYTLPDASGTVALAEQTLPRTIECVNTAYSATINIDFAANTGKSIIVDTLTGNLTFTFSNISQGRFVTVDILCDSTQRNLTFPAATPFVGQKPSSIAASKAARLTFECARTGTTDASVRAAYSVQS